MTREPRRLRQDCRPWVRLLPVRQSIRPSHFLSPAGFGLLYYGQNYLIYPSAFPPGSRTGIQAFPDMHWQRDELTRRIDVPTPEQFNIPYEDLELITQDDVRLKCYLMVQKRSLADLGATEMVLPEDMTDEQVRLLLHI